MMPRLVVHRGRRFAARALVTLLGMVLVSLAGAAWAAGSLPLQTIGQVIASAGDRPTHIVFVHGIRTDARGASFALQGEICAHITGGCTGVRRVSSDLLWIENRPNASFDGEPIWIDDQEWKASRPVIDHYIYERAHGGPVIVDEVNWWRLAFPIKCRVLVATDSRLAGVDARTLRLCAGLKQDKGGLHSAGDDYFGWLSRARFDQILTQRPDGGGAPWANRLLKTEILDWGLSDAVVALGATKAELRETIRCALGAIAGFDPARGAAINPQAPLTPPPLSSASQIDCTGASDPPRSARFVIVSHSLGSFMLLDTFAAATGYIRDIDERERFGAAGSAPPITATGRPLAPSASEELCAEQGDTAAGPPARVATLATARLETARAVIQDRYASLCYVARNNYSLYFLANQFPLLEIARIEQSASPRDGKFEDTLGDWAALSASRRGEREQIVAFSDPGDILTYRVPCIANAAVTNIAVHNAIHWLGLIENPGAAHTGYFTNRQVLATMFGDSSGAAPTGAQAQDCF